MLLEHLPLELLSQIVLRLDATSRINFKYACKRVYAAVKESESKMLFPCVNTSCQRPVLLDALEVFRCFICNGTGPLINGSSICVGVHQDMNQASFQVFDLFPEDDLPLFVPQNCVREVEPMESTRGTLWKCAANHDIGDPKFECWLDIMKRGIGYNHFLTRDSKVVSTLDAQTCINLLRCRACNRNVCRSCLYHKTFIYKSATPHEEYVYCSEDHLQRFETVADMNRLKWSDPILMATRYPIYFE